MRWAASLGLAVLLTGLLSVLIASTAVPAATNTKAVNITANSMQQVLPLGTLIYIRADNDYRPGEIVTYRHNGTLVTHEITGYAINPATGVQDGEWFQTKGTNNPDPDPYPISRDTIEGRVVGYVPYLGVAWKTLNNVNVMAFLFLLGAGLWYVSGRRPPRVRLLKKLHVVYPEEAR